MKEKLLLLLFLVFLMSFVVHGEVTQNNNSTLISYEDVPDTAKNYLLTFLSEDYIKEHFRFLSYEEAPYNKILKFYLVYDNETIDGLYLQWDLRILNGEMRDTGAPHKEYKLNIFRNEARNLMISKGCNISSLDFFSYPDYINGVSNPSYYLRVTNLESDKEFELIEGGLYWKCGGESGGENCYQDQYFLNAETGKVYVIKGYCSVPTEQQEDLDECISCCKTNTDCENMFGKGYICNTETKACEEVRNIGFWQRIINWFKNLFS
jgi:hypothetical protein